MSDNSSLRFKVFQRQEVAKALAAEGQPPLVLECFAGFGILFGRAWRACLPDGAEGSRPFPGGAAIDKERDKARHVARQRPDWIVAKGDNAALLANGFCNWLPFNVLDADAYGSPWDAVLAFLESERARAPELYILATDGLGYKLRVSGGIRVLAPLVERYGERAVREQYHRMVQELLELHLERINAATGSRYALLEFRLHEGGRLNHWTAKLRT